MKHRRFQKDNELFCSGERFHSSPVSLLTDGAATGRIVKGERRNGDSPLCLYLSRTPFTPRSSTRRGRRVVSSGSFISLTETTKRRSLEPPLYPCPTLCVIWKEISGMTDSELHRPPGRPCPGWFCSRRLILRYGGQIFSTLTSLIRAGRRVLQSSGRSVHCTARLFMISPWPTITIHFCEMFKLYDLSFELSVERDSNVHVRSLFVPV